MKLWREFESVRSNLMSQDPFLSLNTYINELPCEEQHYLTKATMEQQKVPTVTFDVAYATRRKSRARDMSKVSAIAVRILVILPINTRKNLQLS